MIRYALRCDLSHGFEAWFRNSSSFEEQAAAGEISCPRCGSVQVARAVMAPGILSGGARDTAEGETGAPADGEVLEAVHGEMVHGEMAAGEVICGDAPATPELALREAVGRAQSPVEVARALRRYVESTATSVGDQFAETALRMHRGEIDDTSIYGSTTPEERAQLADEGIPVQSLPWVPLEDA